MREVMIGGTGMTRFGKYPDASIRSLVGEALREALADAQADPEDVETVFFGNAAAGLLTGQEMITGQVALRDGDPVALGDAVVGGDALADVTHQSEIHLGFDDGRKRAWLFEKELVETERQTEDGFDLTVRWSARQEAKFHEM